MDSLDEMLGGSLNRYFTVLLKTGYVKEDDVDSLILLSFLSEVLKEFRYYITDKDYALIDKIISCLSGKSCLVPYREYIRRSIPLTNYAYNIPIRVAEEVLDSAIRHTLESTLRLVNL